MSKCTGTDCAGCEMGRQHYRDHGCSVEGCTSSHDKKLRVVCEMETNLTEGDHPIKVFWVGVEGAKEPAGQILTTDVVAKWLTDNFGTEQV